MTTQQLLRDIAETRIGLAPSPIHGIGVFALVQIPKGVKELFSPPGEDWPAVPLADMDALPEHVRKLIETYCLQDDTHAYLPPRGFRILDMVIYLNHSDEPNVKQVQGGDYFETLRDIAAGEELFVDYNQLEVN